MKNLVVCSECGIVFNREIAESIDHRFDDGRQHYVTPCCKIELTKEEWDGLHVVA